MSGERSPCPQVIARRELELPLRRSLEVIAVEDSTGHIDVWIRLRTAQRHEAGTIHCAPIALRPIANALQELAGELGVQP